MRTLFEAETNLVVGGLCLCHTNAYDPPIHKNGDDYFTSRGNRVVVRVGIETNDALRCFTDCCPPTVSAWTGAILVNDDEIIEQVICFTWLIHQQMP